MGMFTWRNKQGVESSDGFTLGSKNRYYYHYTEGDLILEVRVDRYFDGSNHYKVVIYIDSIDKWLPPHDQNQISDSEKERIKNNISEALFFMGIDHRFELKP
jgi:hypothetical protein